MVAAEVFKGLKSQARAAGCPVDMDRAVVAVPIRFAPNKRAELRQAAQLAGIEITSFVSEPTAAFFCHRDELRMHQTVGVIDWGGGTLDVSILENRGGEIREIATGGAQIGGDVIDLKLAYWVHGKIASQRSVVKAFEEMSPNDRDMMIARCERAKKELSIREVVEIGLNRYGEIGPFRLPIDIDVFRNIIADEVRQARACFEETLSRARMSLDELGCILMLGGSINLQPFIEMAEKSWNCEKIYPGEPDWSVAQGAGNLSVEQGAYRLAETIGLILADGSFYPLMREGIIVNENPIRVTLALVEDSSTANLIFANGDRTILGYLNVPSFGFFQEKIYLDVLIDRDFVFRVTARSGQRSSRYEERWKYPGPLLTYILPLGSGVANVG
jgi:molecular chaperone DnaK